jgi:hypothetical protein
MINLHGMNCHSWVFFIIYFLIILEMGPIMLGVTPPRVLPKSNLEISWMRGTTTVLTWKLGSTKDTSPRLCLFTQSIPILCSRIRASHTLTLHKSLVYLDSLLTILTLCHSDVQWKNTRNITNTYIVQATPMVPNTWVGLLYCET